ncbi:MAG: hypothetical protein KC910_02250 [Candidatus Eremiobacteraeota bacterium]|nr:hypothetical protein [Candidatus Eremiobacteraeota bacterium]
MRRVVFLALIWLAGLTVASADPRWQAVVDKIEAAHDYAFHYDYRGEEGTYSFSYQAVPKVPMVRTEILEGSSRGVGTVIFYDAKLSTEYVQMKTSFLTLRRSITSRDIEDTSLYIPLFQQLVDRMAKAKLTASSATGDTWTFVFQDESFRHELEADIESNELRAYRRYAKDKLLESLTFGPIRWNSDPTLGL